MMSYTGGGRLQRTLAEVGSLEPDQVKELIVQYNTAVSKRDKLAKKSNLSKEDQRELRRKTREADEAATAIIASMSKLAEVITRELVSRRHGKTPGKEVMFDDLLSEAYACIMEAAKRYDPEKGPAFHTWAANVIRNKIRGLVMDETNSGVKVANSWSRMRRVAILQHQDLYAELGRTPTQAELKERMFEVCLQWGLDHLPASLEGASDEERKEAAIKKLRKQGMLNALENLEDVMATGRYPVFLDAPILGDGTGVTTVGDLIEDPTAHRDIFNEAELEELRDCLNGFLMRFPDRDREIIYLRWGFEDGKRWGFRAIGEKFDISAERVRQIEESVRGHLFENPESREVLRSYLSPEL